MRVMIEVTQLSSRTWQANFIHENLRSPGSQGKSPVEAATHLLVALSDEGLMSFRLTEEG